MELTHILAIGAGSCLGGIARYVLGKVINAGLCCAYPWGTFIVNIAGCLVLGLVYGLIDKGFNLSDGMRLFLTVGFCGGFTTFSTFMHENYLFVGQGEIVSALLYAVLSFGAGLLMIYAGYALSRVF